MNNIKYLILSTVLVGCGPQMFQTKNITVPGNVGEQGSDGVVVLARMNVKVGTLAARNMRGLVHGHTVNITLAENTSMNIDDNSFLIPNITNDVLDFGYFLVTSLKTNNLNKCGANNNTKCSTALFRMYTQGPVGAGFWNSADNYGVPMYASSVLSGVVGLGVYNALTLQTYAIPNNRHTVNLADFNPTPKFNVTGDFTDAGVGDYSTTIVIEFGLSQ